MLGDSDDIKVVGQLGAYLTKTVRAKQNIGRGFVVPIDKYVGYGMSNEILRIFDEMKLDQVILRASPATARDANETIRKVSRNNLLSTINYMQENAKRRYEPCAIVVQELLDGEFCGKVHSCNIYTGAQDEILIEAKLWANNSVLGDDEEPEMILVNKKDGTVSLESNEDELILEAKQVQEIYRAVRKVEQFVDSPVSLDWGFVNGVLYILRTRPIGK